MGVKLVVKHVELCAECEAKLRDMIYLGSRAPEIVSVSPEFETRLRGTLAPDHTKGSGDSESQ